MRTTFTPAPDIADRLVELSRKSKRSLNAVLNDLVRKGLSESMAREPARVPYVVEPFSAQLRPGVDPMKLTEILADIEAFER